MKIIAGITAIALALALSSCEELMLNLAKTVDEDSISIDIGYKNIPDGWRIAIDSDYSRLEWNPEFMISQSGDCISFIDSTGQEMLIDKDSSDVSLSGDNPIVEFHGNRVVLKIRGYRLVFERKKISYKTEEYRESVI